jgi:hypothetical protein
MAVTPHDSGTTFSFLVEPTSPLRASPTPSGATGGGGNDAIDISHLGQTTGRVRSLAVAAPGWFLPARLTRARA